MSNSLTPIQRLAVSRATLAEALRDPLWVMVLRRVHREKAKGCGFL
ncbi:MAG: hypothetical protein RI904_1595 [Pseudomonadota bacterium]|jgi:hypothetical protein